MNEDIKWLRMALKYAKQSPDPRTQNGAVIVKKFSNRTSYVIDCNRFPTGVTPRFDIYMSDEQLLDSEKLKDIEHAERNAIYTASKAGMSLKNSTMYCPWYACCECAKAIIETGITRVVGSKLARELTPERWLEEIKRADTLLKKAGVETILLSDIIGVEILFNNKKEMF